jgi:RecA/RadA recombinase
MSKSFFKTFITDLGDVDTVVASEGASSAEFTGFIDTGSYTMNAALSGSIFGGMPNNKALILAGESTTGKTFYALALVKNYQQQYPDGQVVYFDTESAVTNEMLTERGIDLNRIAKSEPDSIEKFRSMATKMLDKYLEIPVDKRFPLLMVLDSLSALPSKKETEDIANEKDVRDMTKAGLIKGAFRVLRLKMAKAKVPLIITNHVYIVIGAYVPTKEMSGGSGAKYAADTIVFLSKKKERDSDKDVIGNIVTATMVKSRMTKENAKVETRILYDGGLDRYYGLLDYGQEAGIIKRIGNKYEFPNGEKAFEKAVLNQPDKFFTDDVLKQIDAYIQTQFKYSNGTIDVSDAEVLDDNA